MLKGIWHIIRYNYFWILIQLGVLFSANASDIIITEIFFQSEGNVYEYVKKAKDLLALSNRPSKKIVRSKKKK